MIKNWNNIYTILLLTCTISFTECFNATDIDFDPKDYQLPPKFYISYTRTHGEENIVGFELSNNETVVGSYKLGMKHWMHFFEVNEEKFLTINKNDGICERLSMIEIPLEMMNLYCFLNLFPVTKNYVKEEIPAKQQVQLETTIVTREFSIKITMIFGSEKSKVTDLYELKSLVIDKNSLIIKYDIGDWIYTESEIEKNLMEFPITEIFCKNLEKVELPEFPSGPTEYLFKFDDQHFSITIDPVNYLGIYRDQIVSEYTLVNFQTDEKNSCDILKQTPVDKKPLACMKEAYCIYGISDNLEYYFVTRAYYKGEMVYIYSTNQLEYFKLIDNIFYDVYVYRIQESSTSSIPLEIIVLPINAQRFSIKYNASPIRNDYFEDLRHQIRNCIKKPLRTEVTFRFSVDPKNLLSVAYNPKLLTVFNEKIDEIVSNQYDKIRLIPPNILADLDSIVIKFEIIERFNLKKYFYIMENMAMKDGFDVPAKTFDQCIKACFDSIKCLTWSFKGNTCLHNYSSKDPSSMEKYQGSIAGQRLIAPFRKDFSSQEMISIIRHYYETEGIKLLVPFKSKFFILNATDFSVGQSKGKLLSLYNEVRKKYSPFKIGYFQSTLTTPKVINAGQCYLYADRIRENIVRGFTFNKSSQECRIGLYQLVSKPNSQITNSYSNDNLIKYFIDVMKIFNSDDISYYIGGDLREYKNENFTYWRNIDSVKDCGENCYFNSKEICQSFYYSPITNDCFTSSQFIWAPFNKIEKTTDQDKTFRYRISEDSSFQKNNYKLKFSNEKLKKLKRGSLKKPQHDCLSDERCLGYLICYNEVKDLVPSKVYLYQVQDISMSLADDREEFLLCTDQKRKYLENILMQEKYQDIYQISKGGIFACCLIFMLFGFLIFGHKNLIELYVYLKHR